MQFKKRVINITLKINRDYIWFYFIIFYVLWSIREQWLADYLEMLDPVPGAVISAIIKIVVWIIPIILIVKFVEQRDPLSYLGLRHNFRKGVKWAGWASLVIIVCFMILHLIILGNDTEFDIGFNAWLNTVLLVGIIEETVFRGFILRKLMDTFRFWIANIMTALLFAFIHFPIWIHKGLFEFPYILTSTLTAFVLGVIFGYIYRKSNSL